MLSPFWTLFLTLCHLAFGQMASPVTRAESVFASVQSPFFQVQPELSPTVRGEDDLFSHLYRWDFLKYEPTGKQQIFDPACEWKKREPREVKNFAEFSSKWKAYKADCASTFQNGSQWGAVHFYKVMFERFRVQEHPHLRQVNLTYPNGTVVHALLGLKDGKPRPMVVFRMGIFSNVDQMYAERFLLMQLFEQSPFNILAIESMTGSDFIARNKSRSFAGMDEAVQNLHVLKHLRDPAEPISRLVSSVHLLGISMGANGQLLTHILQSQQGAKPWANSTLLLCPPLRLQETLDYHLNHRWRTVLINLWARKRLAQLRREDVGLRDDHFLQDLLDKVARTYQGPIEDAAWIRWPADWSERKKDFWKGNAFLPLVKDVPTPLFILATREDPIVPYLLNSGLIERQQVDLGAAPVLLWPLEKSAHCALPGAYDWREMASIFQDYILSESPEFVRSEKSVQFEIDSEIQSEILRRGFFPHLEIQMSEGALAAEVRVMFYPKAPVSFWQERQLKGRAVMISLASLDLGFEGPAQRPADIEMARRWLHQNLQVTYEKPNLIKLTWKTAPDQK